MIIGKRRIILSKEYASEHDVVRVSQETYENLPMKIKMSKLLFLVLPKEHFNDSAEDCVFLQGDTIFVVRDGEEVERIKLK